MRDTSKTLKYRYYFAIFRHTLETKNMKTEFENRLQTGNFGTESASFPKNTFKGFRVSGSTTGYPS